MLRGLCVAGDGVQQRRSSTINLSSVPCCPLVCDYVCNRAASQKGYIIKANEEVLRLGMQMRGQ